MYFGNLTPGIHFYTAAPPSPHSLKCISAKTTLFNNIRYFDKYENAYFLERFIISLCDIILALGGGTETVIIQLKFVDLYDSEGI